MKGKIKTARKKASRLHGATAQFVSLVDAGANETPFTMIKSKDGAKAMTIKKRGKAKAAKSHKPLAGQNKSAEGEVETRTETVIAKMIFDGDIFESEDEVRSYIEKAEWEAEDIEIVQNDDGDFEARANGLADDDFDKIGKVEIDDDEDSEGVEAWVGQREVEVTLKEDEEDEEEGDEAASSETKSDDEEDEEDDEAAELETEEKGKKKPAKKSASKVKSKKAEPKTKVSKRAEFIAQRKEAVAKQEKVSKFDAWDARFSRGNTLAKTLKDGMEWDGLPPGFYEVQAAFGSAVSNIVADDGNEGKQEALNKAAMDFAEIVGGLDGYFDAFLDAEEETIEKAFPDEDQRQALHKWAEGYGDFVAGKVPAPEAVAKSQADANALAIDYNALSDGVAQSIAKTLEPMLKQVEGVSETVEAMATRAPTKKAADADDGGNAGPRKVKTKKAEGDEPNAAAERFGKTFFG